MSQSRIGNLVESALTPESTPNLTKLHLYRVEHWKQTANEGDQFQPLPTLIPGVCRDSTKIPDKLAATIRACRTGQSPWPLVVTGGIGTGKTCGALCLCDAVGGSAIYRTLPGVCLELLDAQRGDLFFGSEKIAPTAWWMRWSDAPLCVLDELGSDVKVSGFKYDTAKDCIDKREGKPLMVLSNVSVSGIAQIYDERIADRLAAGTVVELSGPSMRTGV